jgi:hypothetical protein
MRPFLTEQNLLDFTEKSQGHFGFLAEVGTGIVTRIEFTPGGWFDARCYAENNKACVRMDWVSDLLLSDFGTRLSLSRPVI